MKHNFYNKKNFMGDTEWRIVNEAFVSAFENVYNPKVMRASAMVTNQAGGDIADIATGMSMIGDVAMTGRQQEMMIGHCFFSESGRR